MRPATTPAGDGGLLRIRLDVAYDGTNFSGWATQPERRTAQGVLEATLGQVMRTSPPVLTVAGRTDAGVHARGQVCHADVLGDLWNALPGRSARPPDSALVHRLAGALPADLRVTSAAEVSSAFDARFSALWRRYTYRVSDAPFGVDPLQRGFVLAYRRPLDIEAMNAAAAGLLGEHDFAAFCRRREGATTIRRLQTLHWERGLDGIAAATIVADAFCHNQVRAMIGALLAVGEGRQRIDWPAGVLAGRKRISDVQVVPPHGLTLEEVGYPRDAELAAQSARTRRVRTLPSP
jgi:tRNA pseudouridine38-40 synthase